MTTSTPSAVRHLTTPAALALADLAAVFEDLQTALACCEHLMGELDPGTSRPDPLALEAFWTTAVTSYARCFAPGPRGTGLTEQDLAATGLPGDVVGWHRVLLQVRDHVTDPAQNPRESFSVGAAQAEDGGADGVAITSSRQPSVDDVTVRQTGAIAYALSRLVDQRIAEQQKVVFGALGIMTRSQLEKLPVLEVAEEG